MNKKVQKEFNSTYERLIHEDLHFEEDLNKGYQEFILSELILAIMQEDHVTVRKLAIAYSRSKGGKGDMDALGKQTT